MDGGGGGCVGSTVCHKSISAPAAGDIRAINHTQVNCKNIQTLNCEN